MPPKRKTLFVLADFGHYMHTKTKGYLFRLACPKVCHNISRGLGVTKSIHVIHVPTRDRVTDKVKNLITGSRATFNTNLYMINQQIMRLIQHFRSVAITTETRTIRITYRAPIQYYQTQCIGIQTAKRGYAPSETDRAYLR